MALFCILYNVIVLKKGTSMNQYRRQQMDDEGASRFTVGMGYVPWQNFTRAYEPQKALKVGTIFPELDKPFKGGKMK